MTTTDPTTTLPQLSTVARLRARLRSPNPAEVVQVSFTGTPAAVTAVARALAQVVVVSEMRHKPSTDQRIRLDAVCHHPTRLGR